MFGECHAHILMDGKNYKEAVTLHRNGVCEEAVRMHLQEWKEAELSFVRDGGDALGVSAFAKQLAPEYGIDYRTPLFAIHKKGHYGGIVGKSFDSWKEYEDLVREAKEGGADFIKIMISGILDFGCAGVLTETGLTSEEIVRMIGTAHDAGMAVMAHCNGDRTCFAALEAGVDSLEHGFFMEEETLHLLAEKETVWIPTLAPVGNLIGNGRFPDEEMKKILIGQMKRIRRAAELGVQIGLGSDAGAYQVLHRKGTADEWDYLQKAGVTSDQVVQTEEQIRRTFQNR